MSTRRLIAAAAGAALLAASASPAVASTGLPVRLARALAVPHVAQSRSGALAVDLASGATLFRRNDGVSLAPASTEKLAVTYAALAKLGPTFQIPTEVLGNGELDGPTWLGSVILKGYGDPTLDTFRLALLARQIRAMGITRITGGVRGDETFFDARRVASGWKPSFLINESPPLSALVVDRGWFRGHVTVLPALAAATTFRDALRRAGVTVTGPVSTGPAGDDSFPLADVESPPLAAIVRFMDHESDNFTAELLLKQLGAVGGGPGTSTAGARAVRETLGADGIPLGGVRVVDGSGLSLLDRTTAKTLVSILRAAWSNPAIQPSFFAALPVAGRSGTLSDRLERPPAVGRVVAKTGTTDRASALSGFVARRFAFAVIQNGYPIATAWARRAQDRFVTVLAAQ
jgi:D-alanyl-D-alanine carboxypeptidase/D-alanyl-D-alanine-endopeptidase (penicillin-binding protein 4)